MKSFDVEKLEEALVLEVFSPNFITKEKACSPINVTKPFQNLILILKIFLDFLPHVENRTISTGMKKKEKTEFYYNQYSLRKRFMRM